MGSSFLGNVTAEKEEEVMTLNDMRLERINNYVDCWDALWQSVDDGRYALMSPEEKRRFNADLHVIKTNTINEFSALRRTK